jgi:hypothetical protein
MATIPELKTQIATYTAELAPLQAAANAAKVISEQAGAAVSANLALPGRTSLLALSKARIALEADPTNAQLQQNLASIRNQWDAQQAVYLPLLAASDKAFAALVAANGPLGDKSNQITDAEIAIAKIDPSQASPEVIQYLKENGLLPIANSSDPALPKVTPTITVNEKTLPLPAADVAETQAATEKAKADYATATPAEKIKIQAITGMSIADLTSVPAGESAPAAATDPNKDHGLPYDDAGILMPGWALDADEVPYWVGDKYVDPTTTASAVASNPAAVRTNVTGSKNVLLNSPSVAAVSPYSQDDWRIRLSLAGSANYLYKIAGKTDILYPLIATDGVVFPYTPIINSSYRANYDPAELTHSNYKMFFYKNSSVDDISITADFTAQDTAEANYMLAVIHFFKSATKMFYGKDTAPRAGTPPPLMYLTGYGQHQFQNHPLLLTNFSYNLPNDVDYIRAGSNAQWGGQSVTTMAVTPSTSRASSSGLPPGGVPPSPSFAGLASKDKVTYVPTKISLSLTFVPVVTRNDISNNFSLKDYAAGTLSAKTGGGIW